MKSKLAELWLLNVTNNLQSSAVIAVVVVLRPNESTLLSDVMLYTPLTVMVYSVNSFNPENVVDLHNNNA